MAVGLQHRFSTIGHASSCRLGLSLPVFILALFMPHVVHAFGAKAHRVVGHVAEQYICVETRAALEQLMPDYSLAEAGVWADKIRGYSSWDYTKPWHFINVPDGVALSAVARSDSGDVLTAIDQFSAELNDPNLTDQQRLKAFYFLVHFVADVHQPLHVGRQSDLGGNRVEVRVNRRKMNLHSYWDTSVIKDEVANAGIYGRALAVRNARVAAAWQDSGPQVWAVESQAFRPEVYDFGVPSEAGRPNLDAAYQARAREIVDLRLAQAGIRLAGMLNNVWCPGKVAGKTD